MRGTNGKAGGLRIEHLEAREMLSGNVTVRVEAGDLVVTGDSLSNTVEVRQVGAGRFTVRGVGTTVNGTTSVKTFSGVTDDVSITMNGGNDVVDLKGPTLDKAVIVPDDLTIDGGSGNDRIDLQNVHVKDDILIETGAGRNVVKGRLVYADDDFTVNKGANNAGDFDTVALSFAGAGNKGDGTLKIDLHGGNDKVYLYNVLTDELQVYARGGDDFVSLVHTNRDTSKSNEIDAGSGRDTVNLFSNTSQSKPSVDNPIPLNGVEVITRKDSLPPAV